MRTRSIKAFVTTYTCRSMTAASYELHVSQSALTKMILSLEERLGVRLFIRHPRGIAPTAYADVLFPYAKRILSELDAVTGELAALSSGKSGRLKVGADSYVAAELLPIAVTAALSRTPDLKVEIVTTTGDNLVAAVADGTLDFLITSVSQSVDLSSLRVIPILTEPYYIVARRGHPLAARKRVDLASVADYPWVNVGEDFSRTSNIAPIFRKAGIKLPENIVETDSITYLVAHLLRSDSLSYQPRRVLAANGLAYLKVGDPPHVLGEFRVVAAHRMGKAPSPGAQLLLGLITESASAAASHPASAPQQPHRLR